MRFLAILFLTASISAAPREWRDSIRDVYINGKLDRTAQTLTTSSPRLIAIVCGDEVLLLDPESKAVSRAPKSDFTFAADRTSATTSAEPKSERAGELVKATDTTFLATLEDATVLVTAHQSKAGAMTIDELWETAPVWRAVAEQYEPDAAVVERLRNIGEPVRLQVVLATWCGDSRQHVPRLLKSIERANNPNITVELMGIGPEFTTPMEVVSGENITNVPTVIVRRGGKEIGRFNETPAGATVEADIADIASGTPKPHPGRHERGTLVTRGAYRLRDGVETFELYERKGGGSVLHSMIRKRDGTSVETWAAVDGEKKPRFAEVTHRGATMTRTRFRRDGDLWHGTSRGADGGIVEQTVLAPAAFVTPATMTYVWAREASRVYAMPESGVGATRNARYRVGRGELPKVVRLDDGSERRLIK